MIQQTVETELAAMLEQYSNVKSIEGRCAVVRNGYLPARARASTSLQFGGRAAVRTKVGARVGGAAVLYLRSISMGGMSEALGIMLGGEVVQACRQTW
ncbi:MAG: hypothetical protein VB142_01405 [Burkholderia sp.]